ncbi:MAG: hypothetical protein ACREXX_15955 [Gammaproteobacteria bacterium]
MHESVRLRHRDSPERYLSEIWKLFDAILEAGFDPAHPHLAKSLPGDFNSLVAQANQRLESVAEDTRETEYDGQRCLLIETRRPKSDDEYGQRGFPYVIVRDATTFHVRVNYFGTATPDLKPIFLQAVGRSLAFEYAQNQRQLLSKEPMSGLSLDKLKEMIGGSERCYNLISTSYPLRRVRAYDKIGQVPAKW